MTARDQASTAQNRCGAPILHAPVDDQRPAGCPHRRTPSAVIPATPQRFVLRDQPPPGHDTQGVGDFRLAKNGDLHLSWPRTGWVVHGRPLHFR
jgi:hypothetical protein